MFVELLPPEAAYPASDTGDLPLKVANVSLLLACGMIDMQMWMVCSAATLKDANLGCHCADAVSRLSDSMEGQKASCLAAC